MTSLDDEKLAEKYRHLAERLSRAFTAAPIVGDERHRYVNALLAIAKFFEGLGPFDTYAEKFITLAAALNDLDNGIVRPVLKPEPVANRIPDPIEVQVGRAYVAIAIEALIKAGNKTDEAKLFIQAREYSPLFALATKKADNLWTAGREWRHRFRQNRIKNVVAKKVFEAGHEHLPPSLNPKIFCHNIIIRAGVGRARDSDAPLWIKQNCARFQPSPTGSTIRAVIANEAFVGCSSGIEYQ